MKEIIIQNKKFKPYISQKQIEAGIKRIASEITRDLSGKDPLFICLLNGSFIFAADLIRRLDFTCSLSFVKVQSYSGCESTGEINEIIGLNESIEGRTVVVLDDIVDSGLTLSCLFKQLKEKKPASLKSAILFFKPDACKTSLKLDYLGMMIDNIFVVGYGLDYNGYGRNYKDLYKIVNE